jgi:hypothetical protein
VKVFTEDQLKKILSACGRYPERNAFGYDNPSRIRAFVVILRYSGLRIGDCVGLRKEHVDGDRLFLRTQKSGESVYVPLPEIAVDALKEVGNGGEYFFWTVEGSANRLWLTGSDPCAASSTKPMSDLLTRGVPMEDVAIRRQRAHVQAYLRDRFSAMRHQQSLPSTMPTSSRLDGSGLRSGCVGCGRETR